jgi:hypothetical protein
MFLIGLVAAVYLLSPDPSTWGPDELGRFYPAHCHYVVDLFRSDCRRLAQDWQDERANQLLIMRVGPDAFYRGFNAYVAATQCPMEGTDLSASLQTCDQANRRAGKVE